MGGLRRWSRGRPGGGAAAAAGLLAGTATLAGAGVAALAYAADPRSGGPPDGFLSLLALAVVAAAVAQFAVVAAIAAAWRRLDRFDADCRAADGAAG